MSPNAITSAGSVIQVDVFVVMTGMFGVPVPVMQVVDVVVVLQGMVSAAGAVHMVVIAEVMLPVGSSAGHRSVDLPSRRGGGLQSKAPQMPKCGSGPRAFDGTVHQPHKLESDRVKNQ